LYLELAIDNATPDVSASEWTGYFLPFTSTSISIRFATVFGPGQNESLNVSRCSQESIAPVDQKLSYLPSRLDGRREP